MADEVENTGIEETTSINNGLKLIEINILPAEFRTTRRSLGFVTDIRVLLPSGIIILAFIVMSLLYVHTQDTLANLDAQLTAIKTKVEKDKPLLEEIKKLNHELDVIAQKNRALKSIQVSKKVWVIMFEAISSVLPENMWLMSVKQSSPGIIDIKGSTYKFNEIASYMVELKSLESFTKVDLISIGAVNQKSESMKSYSFTLKCFINKDLGLKSGQ